MTMGLYPLVGTVGDVGQVMLDNRVLSPVAVAWIKSACHTEHYTKQRLTIATDTSITKIPKKIVISLQYALHRNLYLLLIFIDYLLNVA